MLREILLASVAAAIASAVSTAGPPGWYLGMPGQSCDEACAQWAGWPCSVAGLRKVQSLEALQSVFEQIGVPCTTSQEGDASFSPSRETGDCYWSTLPGVERQCSSSYEIAERACCCAEDPADCPAPSTTGCTRPGRSSASCAEDDRCEFLNWPRAGMSNYVRHIKQLLRAKRRTLPRKKKRQLRRQALTVQRELRACSGHGGCQDKAGSCTKFCRTICNGASECVWSPFGEGCIKSGTATPTPGPYFLD